MLRKIKLFCGIGKKHFVWFDLERHNCIEIDYSVTGSDGAPVPPIDCVRVALGEKVKIYRSKKRGTLHACIRGRAVEWDKQYGLFCDEDFDADNYEALGKFEVSQSKVYPEHQSANQSAILPNYQNNWRAKDR
jgi:hypothetical protein